MDEVEASRQICLELQVHCRNLGADANPVCGLFAIDAQTGELEFLAHTEVQRAAPHPKFGKLLECNFFPGRNQKLQLNIYSAPWKDNIVDNSIKDEDRIGSVIIALDKAVPVNALDRKSFAPVSVELPLWHDTEPGLNDKLAAAGANMKVAFKAAEHQPEQFFAGSGPQADQNIHQALAVMLAGGEFLKYPFGSSGAPQKRFVWYDKNDGPMGTIYWGETAKKKKEKKKSIPVHTITGLFEQNQTDAFRKHQKLGKERTNRCFSIVGKERTLDLEAKSKDIVDAFMTGIHRILSGSGFGVKEVTTQDKDELLSAPVVKNSFIIRAKLRNLPAMPWAHDESNDTLIAMSEKPLGKQAFLPIEQTEWQKGNSNPNFEKELLLPFTIPPANHPIKFNVYDHQINDKHLMGSSVVRLDFFYRYVGQEMMVKLRNAHDAKIDAALCEANAYMLLTADAENPIPGFGMAAAARGNFNSVIDEFKHRGEGGGNLKPSKLRPFFTRSTLAFLQAGAPVTCWSAEPDNGRWAGPCMVYFRSVEPCGQIVLCNEKSGDVDGMDKNGNPKDPLATIPMEHITECRLGISEGQFKADKTKRAKSDCAFTLFFNIEAKDSGAPTTGSLDLETRDVGTATAWATGIQEYISSVLEGREGDNDDDLFSFIKGGPKRGGGGIAGGAFGGKKLADAAADDDDDVGDSLDEAFKPADKAKMQAELVQSEDEDDPNANAGRAAKAGGSSGAAASSRYDNEDVDDIDLFGSDEPRKRKKKGKGGAEDDGGVPGAPPMAPPIAAPDLVLGAGAPPPPPGAPGMSLPKYNGPKMKHIHWEVLAPTDGAEGTLWSLIQDDLDKEASKMLEELFKAADLKAKVKDEKEDEKKGVRLLESKRANNIEIVLKSFRMPNAALRDAVLSVDQTILTQERITALLSMVPNPEEKALLKAYLKSGKPVDKLGVAEQFAIYMLEVPRVDTRLRLLLFQAKYDALVDDMMSQYVRLIAAGEAVKDSKQLMKVMETILSVGNKLNAGTRTGGATAFRLSVLDKLNDTKSADNKQTLLDFIVSYVDKHKKTPEERFADPDPKDIDAGGPNLPSYLDNLVLVKDAALIDWSALNAERETLMHGLQELSKEVSVMKSEEAAAEDKFPAAMISFLEHALHKAKKMKKRYIDAQELIEDLFEYFGESENSFEPTDFFKLFDRFVTNYKQSELKGWQAKLKRKRDKARLAAAAQKKAAGGGEAGGSGGKGGQVEEQGGGIGGLAAMMAARRASIEGADPAVKKAPNNPKSPDDEWDDDAKDKKASAPAKSEPSAKAEPAAPAAAAEAPKAAPVAAAPAPAGVEVGAGGP